MIPQRIYHITLALQKTHLFKHYINTRTPLNTKLKRTAPNIKLCMGQKERLTRDIIKVVHKRKSQSVFPCYKNIHVMSKQKLSSLT